MAIRQFARFVLVGLVATAGNLTAVWSVRSIVPFALALVAGVVTGFCISFVSNKIFTFRSKSWSGYKGEAVRFTLVYSAGATVYWLLAMTTARYLSMQNFALASAEGMATLVGCTGMMCVTFVEHKLYTFRAKGMVVTHHDV